MPQADLHTHSVYSDGSLTPAELVQRAMTLGIDLLALSDHDSIDGLGEAVAAAQGSSLSVIPAVEISSQWQPVSGRGAISIHVVIMNWQQEAPLQDFLMQQQQVRADRARQICHKLQRLTGQDVHADALHLAGGRPEGITRSHLAQALVAHGIVSRQQQAFDRFLGEGKPASVPLHWASLPDVIAMAQQAGAVSVLAHPTRYGPTATRCRRLIEQFAAMGGQAVELPPQREPTATRSMIDREAAKWQLAVSTASDFHGDHMPWARLGQVPVLAQGQQPVWELF